MTYSDIDTRAQRLVELEKERDAKQEARRREQQEASRLANARKRIRQHDREREMERARKTAAQEADDLSRRRHELEERLEAEVGTVNRSLAELEALDRRHQDALRRAGRQLDHGQRLGDVIARWWRARFGGWNSLTGTPSPHWNAQEGPLHELDPLTRPVSGRTQGEAS
jgi:hypothetical protein